MSQLRDAKAFRSKERKGKLIQPLGMEEAKDLSQKTLEQACRFMSWISVDQDWDSSMLTHVDA